MKQLWVYLCVIGVWVWQCGVGPAPANRGL